MRQFARRVETKLLGRPYLTKPDPKEYTTLVGKGSFVPCQVEAYFLALNQYVDEGAKVLDVGFGLGYGMNILAIKAAEITGVDIDPKVLEYCQETVIGRNPRVKELMLYDGLHLKFPDNSFDVLTCVDVLEHVQEYDAFLDELLRVARKGVLISTPFRRPENTNSDGTPKNYWHLREWVYEELDPILKHHSNQISWHYLNGPFEGPFTTSTTVQPQTFTLTPFIYKPDTSHSGSN
ncbi:MAG: methyltransferase domain-containing protein [Chloroflexota bacterium]